MTKSVTIEKNAGNVYVGDSPEYEIDTAINELLNHLASKRDEFKRINRKPTPVTIQKIKHNNIGSKKHIIKQYLDHSSKIESALHDIDSSITFGKHIVFQNLNDLYYSALDELDIEYLYEDIDINEIRKSSDYILDFIIQKLKNSAFESKNTPILKENIELGVNVIVAHAFIECIIMEGPNS